MKTTAYPIQLSAAFAWYLAKNQIRGTKRYPITLMLEPLFRCNLRCNGCGRIREFSDVLDETLSVKDCLSSAEQAGAPMVSITGGEPLLHPKIEDIVNGIIGQGRFVNLCTNGILLEKSIGKFHPSSHLSFVIHLDGMAETHDKFAGRNGVFDSAVTAIKSARKAGFRVFTNTTIYKNTNINEIEQLFIMLAHIPVNGIITAPAFNYSSVDNDVFLNRQEIIEIFQPIYRLRHKVPFYNTPLYIEFLAGKIGLKCSPWSMPTRNPKGWKSPCYLLTNGHFSSFRELREKTSWDIYGPGNNRECSDCMVHCGFEASAINAIMANPSNLVRTIKGLV
jgi:hopanoid biosynthesis associated radical SAM protein HpnH